MPTIAVTGATGHLGRLTVESLLDRGVAPGSIVAAVRTPDNAADLADRGVVVREADYDRPETLGPALEGVDRMLFVSSNTEPRFEQHQNVVAAAQDAAVELVAYTSVLNAETTTMRLADDHKKTETLLRESGLPWVFLRNGWYTENYSQYLAISLEHGLVAASGDGRVALAARQDYAEAAAVVLSRDGHAGHAYELAGDEVLTLAQVAAIMSEATGRDVPYIDLPVDRYAEILAQAGTPEPFNEVVADASAALKRGELFDDSHTLSRLIGRPTTPVADTIRAAAASLDV